MPKSQRDRARRGDVKRPTERTPIKLGRLATLIDKQLALNMLAKVAANGGQHYHPGIDAAIRAVSASAGIQIRAVQLELAGANLEGQRDVHVTFNDLEPLLREATAEIERLKAKVTEMERPPDSTPSTPSSSSGHTLN